MAWEHGCVGGMSRCSGRCRLTEQLGSDTAALQEKLQIAHSPMASFGRRLRTHSLGVNGGQSAISASKQPGAGAILTRREQGLSTTLAHVPHCGGIGPASGLRPAVAPKTTITLIQIPSLRSAPCTHSAASACRLRGAGQGALYAAVTIEPKFHAWTEADQLVT
ncbi:hypothetical protein BDY21DRAFT_210251 [Lineolata rhizophorae]|uniref:Uncharacterized protein n=1 Tax=Lineolata rhizophorae TaxID=578093 RepID=A0A6A6P3Z5_9PEZI|nr:hypothetical protein BDY21DRAFT_210251 [Lineolata rhizophorae]